MLCLSGLEGKKSNEVQSLLDTEDGDDGVVTKEEFKLAMKNVLAKVGVPTPSTLEELWAVLDKDSSGTLTAGEVWQGVKKGLFSFVPGMSCLVSRVFSSRLASRGSCRVSCFHIVARLVSRASRMRHG